MRGNHWELKACASSESRPLGEEAAPLALRGLPTGSVATTSSTKGLASTSSSDNIIGSWTEEIILLEEWARTLLDLLTPCIFGYGIFLEGAAVIGEPFLFLSTDWEKEWTGTWTCESTPIKKGTSEQIRNDRHRKGINEKSHMKQEDPK